MAYEKKIEPIARYEVFMAGYVLNVIFLDDVFLDSMSQHRKNKKPQIHITILFDIVFGPTMVRNW